MERGPSGRGLTSMVNPDTFRQINYQCLQAGLSNDDLIIVGCDIGRSRDIWFTTVSWNR